MSVMSVGKKPKALVRSVLEFSGRRQEAAGASASVGSAGRRRSRRCRASRCGAGRGRPERCRAKGRGTEAAGASRRGRSQPGCPAPGGPERPRGRVWSGPHRCRPGYLSSASGEPRLTRRGRRWSGLSRFSSSSRCSPRCCLLWRPVRRRPIVAVAVGRAGQHAARRGQARSVPVVDRVERTSPPGRSAGGHPARSWNSTRWAARSWCLGRACGSPGAEPRDPVFGGPAPGRSGSRRLGVPPWQFFGAGFGLLRLQQLAGAVDVPVREAPGATGRRAHTAPWACTSRAVLGGPWRPSTGDAQTR